MNTQNNIITKSYKISKLYVEKYLPEENNFFETIWEAMQTVLKKWENIEPNKWSLGTSFKLFQEHLAFTSAHPDFLTPLIIATISAAADYLKLHNIINIDNIKSPQVKNIIKEYAQQFGAPLRLANHLSNTIPELFNSDYLIGRAVSTMDEKYKVITNDSPESKIITKDELEEMKKNPDVLIIHNGKIKFKNNIATIGKRGLEFLNILLKYPGHKFSYQDLDQRIYGAKSRDPDDSQGYVQQIKHRICNDIPELENFIGVRDGYFLNEGLKYCLVEGVDLAPANKDN